LKAPALTIAICTAVLAAGCGGGDSSTSSAEAKCVIKPAGKVNTKTKPTVEVPDCTPPPTLVVGDLKQGSGATAKAGEEVKVQYVGVNFKTGEEFDASWDRHEPFVFKLGAGMVIPGWDQGVQGMKVGGRRELIIPPALGYGAAGSPPAIPPNETLVFVIDLLAVN
jgi:peptidylprolyl isomerase